MENHVYDCYEVKLSRVFNLITEQNRMWVLGAVGVSVIALLAGLLLPKVGLGKAALIILFSALFLLVKVFSFPGSMDVTPATVKFCHRGALLHLLLHGQIRLDRSYTDEYTLYHITEIEYLQSVLEKRFHVGRVRLHGKANVKKGEDSFSEEGVYTVYGVKDFENTAQWMMEYIQLTK